MKLRSSPSKAPSFVSSRGSVRCEGLIRVLLCNAVACCCLLSVLLSLLFLARWLLNPNDCAPPAGPYTPFYTQQAVRATINTTAYSVSRQFATAAAAAVPPQKASRQKWAGHTGRTAEHNRRRTPVIHKNYHRVSYSAEPTAAGPGVGVRKTAHPLCKGD